MSCVADTVIVFTWCARHVSVYCYVRHTHYTHCTTTRDDSDDDSIELQLDLFCILTYEPWISHIDGPLTLEGNLRSLTLTYVSIRASDLRSNDDRSSDGHGGRQSIPRADRIFWTLPRFLQTCHALRSEFHSHTHRIFPISRRFRVVGQTPLRSSFPIWKTLPEPKFYADSEYDLRMIKMLQV